MLASLGRVACNGRVGVTVVIVIVVAASVGDGRGRRRRQVVTSSFIVVALTTVTAVVYDVAVHSAVMVIVSFVVTVLFCMLSNSSRQ